MRLNSRAFLETPVHQSPHIKFEWLDGDADDIIALTGGPDGPISAALGAGNAELAAVRCERLIVKSPLRRLEVDSAATCDRQR